MNPNIYFVHTVELLMAHISTTYYYMYSNNNTEAFFYFRYTDKMSMADLTFS